MNYFNVRELWTLKVQFIPILLALVLTELPNVIRRLKAFYYIPIYFSVFPLRDLNSNLAIYLGEDYFVGFGKTLDEAKLKEIKKKIVLDSFISVLISGVIIPALVGFILAFFSRQI